MALFHATTREYAAGDVVMASEQSSFYPLAVPALEAARPAGSPSRATCVFATDDINFAYLFAIKQNWPRDQIHLYEVAMDQFHRSPMAIVHAAQRRLEQSGSVDALVAEYWNTTMAWKYYECFGPQMTVVGAVGAPTINELIMGFEYQNDAARASRM